MRRYVTDTHYFSHKFRFLLVIFQMFRLKSCTSLDKLQIRQRNALVPKLS
jgi:hypothetical protein